MLYQPNLLDQALELEIQAAGKRIEHYARYVWPYEWSAAAFWERRMKKKIGLRSAEYVAWLEQQREHG